MHRTDMLIQARPLTAIAGKGGVMQSVSARKSGALLSLVGEPRDSAAVGAVPERDGKVAGHVEALLAAMLDELDFGVCVCDAAGRLIAANSSARAELSVGGALTLEQNQICTAQASSSQIFRNALHDAAHAGLRRMVSLGRGLDRLVIAVSPAGIAAGGNVILLFGRRMVCSALGLEMLAGIHGLTYGERRVLSYVLAGSRPTAISQALGVAVSTVRTQIKSIRAKFNVDSIDALLIRVAAVPPVTTVLRHGKSVAPVDGVLFSAS